MTAGAFWRSEVEGLPAYQTGGAFRERLLKHGITRPVKLNANEGAFGPLPVAIEAISRAAAELRRYPETTGEPFKAELAAHLGLAPAQIVLGNGAGSLIRLIALLSLRPGDEVVVPWPSFPQYVVAAHLMGAAVAKAPLRHGAPDVDALLAAITDRTKLVFLCNPNNPTGGYASLADVTRYLAKVPDHVLTVLDEAYREFVTAPDYPDGKDLLAAGKPIIVLRTFSKVFGLAGLRLGYGLAQPEVIHVLDRGREPFAVSSLALAAAAASLAETRNIAERVAANAEGRAYLTRSCRDMGLGVDDSQANYIFVETPLDSPELFDRLLARGVLVRPGTVYGCPKHVRVTVGSADENEAFVNALAGCDVRSPRSG
ncbi:MAG: histidinol-phosphate transaminase [Chloroflexota bacterium]